MATVPTTQDFADKDLAEAFEAIEDEFDNCRRLLKQFRREPEDDAKKTDYESARSNLGLLLNKVASDTAINFGASNPDAGKREEGAKAGKLHLYLLKQYHEDLPASGVVQVLALVDSKVYQKTTSSVPVAPSYDGTIKFSQLKELVTVYNGVKHPLVPVEFLTRYDEAIVASSSKDLPEQVKVSTIRMVLKDVALKWHDNVRRKAELGYVREKAQMEGWAQYKAAFLQEFQAPVSYAEQNRIRNRLASDAKSLSGHGLLAACEEAAMAILSDKPHNHLFQTERELLAINLFTTHCDALVRSKLANTDPAKQLNRSDVLLAIDMADTQREMARVSVNKTSVLLTELMSELGEQQTEALQAAFVQSGRGGGGGARPPGGNRNSGKCYHCQLEGHLKHECTKFKVEKPQEYQEYCARRLANRQRGGRGRGGRRGGGQHNRNVAPVQANVAVGETPEEPKDTSKDDPKDKNETVATVQSSANMDGVLHDMFLHRPEPMLPL